jgi:hypothetical protein
VCAQQSPPAGQVGQMEGARVVSEVWAAQHEVCVVPALSRDQRQGQAPIPGREAGGRVKLKKPKRRTVAEKYALVMLAMCSEHQLPIPDAEWVFAPPRRWRFDFAWPDQRVALEIQGGLFVQGRHTRGAALLKEHEKLNAAAALGWRVLYTSPSHILQIIPMLRDALKVSA